MKLTIKRGILIFIALFHLSRFADASSETLDKLNKMVSLSEKNTTVQEWIQAFAKPTEYPTYQKYYKRYFNLTMPPMVHNGDSISYLNSAHSDLVTFDLVQIKDRVYLLHQGQFMNRLKGEDLDTYLRRSLPSKKQSFFSSLIPDAFADQPEVPLSVIATLISAGIHKNPIVYTKDETSRSLVHSTVQKWLNDSKNLKVTCNKPSLQDKSYGATVTFLKSNQSMRVPESPKPSQFNVEYQDSSISIDDLNKQQIGDLFRDKTVELAGKIPEYAEMRKRREALQAERDKIQDSSSHRKTEEQQESKWNADIENKAIIDELINRCDFSETMRVSNLQLEFNDWNPLFKAWMSMSKIEIKEFYQFCSERQILPNLFRNKKNQNYANMKEIGFCRYADHKVSPGTKAISMQEMTDMPYVDKSKSLSQVCSNILRSHPEVIRVSNLYLEGNPDTNLKVKIKAINQLSDNMARIRMKLNDQLETAITAASCCRNTDCRSNLESSDSSVKSSPANSTVPKGTK